MHGATRPIEIRRPRARPRVGVRRALALLLMLVIAAAWFVFLRPGALGGPATYVIVAGASMEPKLHSNDLVVAFEERSYSVGDVVVYRVPAAESGAGTYIVHRIVGGDPHRGFLVQGDSRQGPDHWEPRADEILGKMQLHVPHVGTALVFLRGPAGLALIAGLISFLLVLWVFAGSGAEARQRER